MRRLRHAACLLGDIGWAANPDFRAERGMESALHGNWTGLTAEGRALIAQALAAAFGGGNIQQRLLGQLASQEDLAAARSWGLAMRLAQRLSGGVAAPLQASTLERRDKTLRLAFAPEAADLAGEAVERRLRQLAGALGLSWEIK
jgi:exopolyphosphatase/guanosine-5'-triphosphate,3'-diphosphate pyrophosphatase